jgi:hypothetical protein
VVGAAVVVVGAAVVVVTCVVVVAGWVVVVTSAVVVVTTSRAQRPWRCPLTEMLSCCLDRAPATETPVLSTSAVATK